MRGRKKRGMRRAMVNNFICGHADASNIKRKQKRNKKKQNKQQNKPKLNCFLFSLTPEVTRADSRQLPLKKKLTISLHVVLAHFLKKWFPYIAVQMVGKQRVECWILFNRLMTHFISYLKVDLEWFGIRNMDLTRPNTRHKMHLAIIWENALQTDGPTDGGTEGWTDTPSYTDGWPNLKM